MAEYGTCLDQIADIVKGRFPDPGAISGSARELRAALWTLRKRATAAEKRAKMAEQREAVLQEAVKVFLADHETAAEYQSSGRNLMCGCAACEKVRLARQGERPEHAVQDAQTGASTRREGDGASRAVASPDSRSATLADVRPLVESLSATPSQRGAKLLGPAPRAPGEAVTETREEAVEAMAGRASELERRVAELGAQLADAEEDRRRQMERYEALDRHWAATAETQRARFADTQARLASDLREVEIQLAAARAARVEAEPDTEMVSLIREITDAHGAASVPFLDDAVKHAILTVEKRAEELEHKAEARLDCHAGPGTTEPACGGCISCLTRALEEAERLAKLAEAAAHSLESDLSLASNGIRMANGRQARAEYALDRSQQREAGLREALEQAAGDLELVADLLALGPKTSIAPNEARAAATAARAALAAHQGAGAIVAPCPECVSERGHVDPGCQHCHGTGRCPSSDPTAPAALSPAPAGTAGCVECGKQVGHTRECSHNTLPESMRSGVAAPAGTKGDHRG